MSLGGFIQAINPLSEKVPDQVKKMRMSKCNSCQFLKPGTGSCGTLLLGDTVQFNFMTVKLCGCVVSLKTEVPSERCPISKWLEYTR